ncbi:hypothetical protein OC861_005364 [Tilletia horrida]|nr:hypothetical protein OC861_005364 [Tilletia horrida]
MADQVEEAEAKLWDGKTINQSQRNHWMSSTDSVAQLYFRKAEEMVSTAVLKPQLVSGPLLYNQRMRLALLAGKRKQAFSIYNEMKKDGIAPSAVTLTIMFDGLSNIARYMHVDLNDQATFAQQVDRLAHDLKRLHHDGSMHWISSSETRSGARETTRHRSEAVPSGKSDDAPVAQGSGAIYHQSHTAKALQLKKHTAPLCRAYAAYLQLLSRTSVGHPERVWQVYESLRKGDGRPEKVSVRDFARPFRSKAIFTTMLWFAIQQVADPEARRLTASAILAAQQKAKAANEGTPDPEPIAEKATGWQHQKKIKDERDILSDASIPSTPYGQAKQLWLDWETTIRDAQMYGLWPMNDIPRELEVDEQAYRLFTDFFSKCRTPEQQAFVEHIEKSPATRTVRKSLT